MIKTYALIGMVLCFSACAIPTKQTDTFLREPRDIPDMLTIQEVPFVEQEDNYCGPASLAMLMAHGGRPVPVDVLAKQVYTPEKKGSLQADLVGAARRNGMMAIEVSGISALLHEIAAGHPVLTFENLGLSWYPAWHYAVAYGYDLSRPSLTMHSGAKRGLQKDLRKFERSWKDSNYWGLVILEPGRLAVSADDLAHTIAAAGLEQVGMTHEAERAYLSILARWPESLGALIGMGNIRFAVNAPEESARYLEKAVRAHPQSSMAWHNLAVAQAASRRRKQARVSALRAVELASASDAEVYRTSLKQWLTEDVGATR